VNWDSSPENHFHVKLCFFAFHPLSFFVPNPEFSHPSSM
jgi:hypothetical protein